jgi:hypothetical protein
MRRLFTFLVLLVVGAAALAPTHALAEAPGTVIAVYGDSLADGLWSGLYDLTKSTPTIRLLRHSHIGTGLSRPDYATWQNEVTAELDSDGDTVVVIMVGLNDMQGIRGDDRRGFSFKSPGWASVYNARIDWLLGQIKQRQIQAIWVGLPVMRKAETDEDAKYLSQLFETATKRNDALFIPLYKDFVDADGNFMPRIDDEKKRSHPLRGEDGIHFTGYGYQLVAAKVLDRIKQIEAASGLTPGGE